MDWPEWIKSANGLIGLFGAVFTAGWGAVAWADRRQKKRAIEAVSTMRQDHADTTRTLEQVSEKVNRLERETEQGFDDLESRVRSVEKTLESVARTSDVARVENQLSGLNSTVKAVLNQVNMMFEAQLKRERGNDK